MASFRILTFGCKVNQCDSQIIRETLTTWGLKEMDLREPTPTEASTSPAAGPQDADLVVINTCTVTSGADAKFRKALRRTRRENPNALILVTGCHANNALDFSRQLPGSDLIFRTRDVSTLADFLHERAMVDTCPTIDAHTQSYFAEHTRAFLKIQDGCDCFCSYCIVPIVRPKLWSQQPERVIAAINNFSAKGYREVVLTGIHLGFFGRDLGRDRLIALLKRVERECEIERVRLSSIEVNEVTDEMLGLIAGSGKFCRHLHLPLQSGDDEILRKMGRRYSSAFFSRRVEEIRAWVPEIGITTDVLVGFPGESDEQFQHTCEIVRNLEFAKIHVFRFSSRPGTRAAEMRNPVSPNMIAIRARHLIKLGENTALRYKERFIGKTVEVLVENSSNNGNSCYGLTSNYIKVKVLDVSGDAINRILPVRISGVDGRSGIATGQLC